MKDSTKRVIDLLTLPVLGLLAAVIWFGYINNTHPPKIWAVLLMFDIPFASAALIWLGWRLFSIILRDERKKRIIDWLTLIPLGFPPVAAVWAQYTYNGYPPVVWTVLLIVDLPLAIASLIWLALRVDKISIVRWCYYNIARFPDRVILFAFGCLAIVLLIKRLSR